MAMGNLIPAKVATRMVVLLETQGRENKPELYENDVIGKVAKRKKNDIWTRGGEKRTKFKDE